MTRYTMHGYSVESDVVLDLPVATPSAAAVDEDVVLRLRRGPDRPVPASGPGGDLLAELEDDDLRTYYRIARTADGIVLRFRGLADFVGDVELAEVTVHVDPDADRHLVPVLVQGVVLATRLILDGRLVLHASALDIGSGAVAFVGTAGMGKSTMAALGLAAGHRVLTDDALRVDLDGAGPPLAWPGSTELRLRETARRLVDASSRPVRTTADGRTALSTGARVGGPLPLRCCVVPLLDQQATETSIRILDPVRALAYLLACPRVVGWCDPVTSAEQFHLVAELCEHTPVVEARLPWGRAAPDHLLERLFELIDAELGTPLPATAP